MMIHRSQYTSWIRQFSFHSPNSCTRHNDHQLDNIRSYSRGSGHPKNLPYSRKSFCRQALKRQHNHDLIYYETSVAMFRRLFTLRIEARATDYHSKNER
jgi:hypothetical protein